MKKIQRLLFSVFYALFTILQKRGIIAKATKDYVWWKIFLRQCEPDLKPKRCLKCGRQDFDEIVKDMIEGHVCEIEVKCGHCETVNGYWAYGSYYPY
jgi:hypothetical protein